MKKIFLLFAIVSINAFGQNDKFDKIDSLLTFLSANNKFMGNVAIQENNKVVFSKTYGFSNAEKQTVANENTGYKIGSITKTVTSVMIHQLIDEKKLSAETKLSKFYPSIQNSETISIENLLEHSSGIFSLTDFPDYLEFAKAPKTRAEIMKKIKTGKPSFEPGTQTEYSNSNYIILGWIIEDLTKKTYEENLKTRISNKIQLTNTGVSSGKNTEALSYYFAGKNWTSASTEDMSIPGGAGAIVSTASDLTKFAHALFSGNLVKPESLQAMMDVEKGYGKGLVVLPFGERKFYGHNGGIENFTSTFGYYPKEKLGIAVIQNGQGYDINNVMLGILSIYYKMPYRFPNVKSVEVASATLKQYEGVYSGPNFPMKISIKEENGVLICQATGQDSFPLNPLSENRFNFDPAGLELVFEPNFMTIIQGGMEMKLKKE